METATARSEKNNTNLPVLHLAFELSNKNWKLGFTVGLGQTPRERSVPARDMAQVLAEMRQRNGALSWMTAPGW